MKRAAAGKPIYFDQQGVGLTKGTFVRWNESQDIATIKLQDGTEVQVHYSDLRAENSAAETTQPPWVREVG